MNILAQIDIEIDHFLSRTLNEFGSFNMQLLQKVRICRVTFTTQIVFHITKGSLILFVHSAAKRSMKQNKSRNITRFTCVHRNIVIFVTS